MKNKIADIIEECERLILDQLEYLEDHVYSLSDEHLEWRPGPQKWNIYEVVEHLNRFGDFYLPKLDNLSTYPKSLRKGPYYRSGPLAEFAFKRTRPIDGVVRYKNRAPGRAVPFLRKLDRSVFDIHTNHQYKLQRIIKKSAVLNLGSNRVPTILADWLRLNFGDTVRLMIYHQERHYIQIDNLVKKISQED